MWWRLQFLSVVRSVRGVVDVDVDVVDTFRLLFIANRLLTMDFINPFLCIRINLHSWRAPGVD